MVHQQFYALRINIVRALNVVILRNVGHLVGETLSVKVFFRVMSLVLNHMVGDHDVLEAGLLAVCAIVTSLFVALVKTKLILGVDHGFGALIDLLQL